MQIFNKNISKDYPEFDIEAYKEAAKISDFIESKDIDATLRLALGCFGTNGIFFFFLTKHEDPEDIATSMNHALQRLNLTIPGITYFVRAKDKDYCYIDQKLIEKEYLLDCFTNIYSNTQLSSITLQTLNLSDAELMDKEFQEVEFEDVEDVDEEANRYVAPRVSDSQLNIIYDQISKYTPTGVEQKEIIIDDVKYVKHAVKTRFLGYTYTEQYYPVSTANPTKYLIITILGGLFGVHKLITHEYGKFLLYLLTCGGFGVLYFMDVLSIATGCYYIDQVNYTEDDAGNIARSKLRIYLDHVPVRLYRYTGLILSAVLAFFVVKYGYFKVLYNITYKLQENGRARVEQISNEYADMLEEEGSEEEWQQLLKTKY